LADRDMPLQNRVTPEGEIVAHATRGLMMGNRGGALHDEHRTLRRRRWVSRQWICCRLAFKDRHRQVMSPGQYTELFFLDEATALAAGHRPCFECRRDDAVAFATLWARLRGKDGRASAREMDDVLHAERVDARGRKVTYIAELDDLPDGTFIRHQGQPCLVFAGSIHPWTPDGYQRPQPRPRNCQLEVLTPRSVVSVLAAGFTAAMHPSATARPLNQAG
jgi:hypothetical protein